MKKFLFFICTVLAILSCGGDDSDLPCLSMSTCDLCYKQPFNPLTEFCSDSTVYSKCGGLDYDPNTYGCCDTTTFILSTQFCSDSITYYKCNGNEYNPSAYQYCSNDSVKTYDTISYGGQTYRTVVIGTQTWFAENLSKGDSACPSNQARNCAVYGRLYDWSTAMALPLSCNSNFCSSQIQSPHKGICPEGWHIPSNADWDKLYRYIDSTSETLSPYSSPTAGKYLKAMSGWSDCGPSGSGSSYLCEGTYGFLALPGGWGVLGSDSSFRTAGENGYWWSINEVSDKFAYYRTLSNLSEVAGWNYSDKYWLLSVRCLRN